MSNVSRLSWLAKAVSFAAFISVTAIGQHLVAQQQDAPTLDSVAIEASESEPQVTLPCDHPCPPGTAEWRSFKSAYTLASGCKVGVMVYYRVDCDGNYEFTIVDWQVAATAPCYSMTPLELRREVERAILNENRMGWDPQGSGDPCLYAIKAQRVECYDRVWRATNPLLEDEPGWLWTPCATSIHACCEFLWQVCWVGGEEGHREPMPVGVAIPRVPDCENEQMPWESFTGCINLCPYQ